MFSKSSSKTQTVATGNNGNESGPGTINLIGQGTVIKGTIETQGDLRIEGRFDGELHSEAKVVLGETAEVYGTVHCQNADLSGRMEGHLFVHQQCYLKETAHFEGELYTGKLRVDYGAALTFDRCLSNWDGAEDKPARRDEASLEAAASPDTQALHTANGRSKKGEKAH
jgi:cytoskeletal protein CcmA (bactofilin family)